jgi:GNAT superfamily N-acetyltransferase
MTIAARPFAPGDMPGVLRVLAQAMPADPISENRFTRQVLLDPNFRAEGAIVAECGGDVAGFCLALARQVPLENAPSDAERGYITLLAVQPSDQRQGVGSRLIEAAESYLRAQNRSLVMIASYAPNYFIPGVDVDVYSGALSFLKRHGYAEVYRPLAMQTSLWNWSAPQWIEEKGAVLMQEGVTVEPYDPRWTLPLLSFTAAEFPGDWVRVVREAMTRITLGDSPQRLIIAHEAGRVLGFSHYDNERFGPIGVSAGQRGRGIGQVLMCRTLQAQREAGLRVAWFLWSDDKTAARIYSGVGFSEVRRFALMKKSMN